MARYIDADKLLKIVKDATPMNWTNSEAEIQAQLDWKCCIALIKNQPTADVAEVKHGKWHILPDDPYDESGVPTEEGWYRIITADGQETTDYFFNKPTMCEHGITYWKNARSTIRAWAKMDGGKEE